jgi:AhpD family alkylhydroperoxidase
MSFVERITQDTESVSEILRPYARIAGPLSELTEHILRGSDSSFSVAERELIGAFVSGVNACTFCCDTHQAAAEAMGVPTCVDALLLDIDGAPGGRSPETVCASCEN